MKSKESHGDSSHGQNKVIALFLHIPFLLSCLFSFCPKEGHFCPMGDKNIDVKRWVIDWKERTASQLTCSRQRQVPSSISIHTWQWHVRRNRFILGWYVSIAFYTTSQLDKHVYWSKRRMWALVSSAGHMSFVACSTSLHVGKLMQQRFVLTPHPQYIYEEIMRLHSVLIEWDDDIDMK